MVAERLGTRLGQAVIVENRPGAGGNLGGEAALAAEPDGHTLFFTTIGTGAMNFAVYGARMPWRAGRHGRGRAGGAHAQRADGRQPPARCATWRLPRTGRARPRRDHLRHGGIGSSPHVCMELLGPADRHALSPTSRIAVPGRMLTDLMAERTDCGMDNIPSALPFVRENRLRAIGMSGAARSAVVPECRPSPRRCRASKPPPGSACRPRPQPARGHRAHRRRAGRHHPRGRPSRPPRRVRRRPAGADAGCGTSRTPSRPSPRAEVAKWGEVIRKAGIRVE
jgi:hypothetical protein